MSEVFEFSIDNDSSGTRLDKYLSEQLEDVSRSYIQKLSDEGAIVLLSGSSEKPLKASYKLREGYPGLWARVL